MSRGWRSRLAGELTSRPLFDEGVEVARNACVAGASIASAAISAAAWYSNPLTGIPALCSCMQLLGTLPRTVRAWQRALGRASVPCGNSSGRAPGFGFVGPAQAVEILNACRRLASSPDGSRVSGCTAFFAKHAEAIGRVSGPLNQVGLAALQFVDHQVSVEEAERWYLLCRMRTAIAAAQRARKGGIAAFPFFTREYAYEGRWPQPRSFDFEELRKRVGV